MYLYMISFLGYCVKNLLQVLDYVKKGNLQIKAVISQACAISFDSLSISLSIVFIASAVIALQVSKQFLLTGADAYVGGFLSIALIREIAPGFAALAIAARAGTAICAQIANMQVTEQIDAMNTLQVNPIGYYFAPRIIASALTVPLVVIIAEFIGIVGGMLVAFFAIDLHPYRYMNSVWLLTMTKDIYISIIKAFVFGIIIAIVCATQGYQTKGGAKDVGISTTKSAIKSTIYLLIADFILNIIYYM